jgi:uncharacterized protein
LKEFVMADTRDTAIAAAKLIHDAGNEVVGKTRIQKAAYFLECMGLGDDFDFYYKHYGPYSDELTNALHYARELGLTEEENKKAAWGGTYTVFHTAVDLGPAQNPARTQVLTIARNANPVALELAATALFLKREGENDPWREVKTLKPSKASRENLGIAKKLYETFRQIEAPESLPAL